MIGVGVSVPNGFEEEDYSVIKSYNGLSWTLNDDGVTYQSTSFNWDNITKTPSCDHSWICNLVNLSTQTGTQYLGYCYNFMPF